MHSRSAALSNFSLGDSALLLPPPVLQSRHLSSAGAWTTDALPPLQTASFRPGFLDPLPVSVQSSISAFAQPARQQTQYYAAPVAAPLLPAQALLPPPAPIQFQPPFVPQAGTGGYQFGPWIEVDDKQQYVYFASMACRPEMAHRSPEELRLEDYALQGAASLSTSAVSAPGVVDMGLRPQQPLMQPFQPFVQQQQQQPVQQQSSVFAFNPSAGTSLFGTSTTYGKPAVSSFGAFGTASSNAFAAPQWGTATAGFGGFAAQQQSNVWGAPSSSSAFAAPQTNAFAAVPQTNAFSFLQPQHQNNALGFPAATSSSAFSFAPVLAAAPFVFAAPSFAQQQPLLFGSYSAPLPFGFAAPRAFSGCGQTPTQALFFWSTPREACWASWMASLPSTISHASFGGVEVELPSVAYCAAQRLKEKNRIAKCDADPYGVGLIQPLPRLPSPAPVEAVELAASKSANNGDSASADGVTAASAIKRGTSSPLLTPTRSPLLPPRSVNLADVSKLLLTPGQHGRSLTASLSHSPKLAPLPASPYVDGVHGALSYTRSQSLHGSPTKAPAPSSHQSHHHSAASVLFGCQSESAGSPSRALATPERRRSLAFHHAQLIE